MDLRNVGILSQHYTASRIRTPPMKLVPRPDGDNPPPPQLDLIPPGQQPIGMTTFMLSSVISKQPYGSSDGSGLVWDDLISSGRNEGVLDGMGDGLMMDFIRNCQGRWKKHRRVYPKVSGLAAWS